MVPSAASEHPGWLFELGADVADEMVDHARRRLHDGIDELDPNGTAARVLDHVLDELLHGQGVALLRGLPAERLDDTENASLCLAISRRLGIPIRQNAAGDELIRVRDEGKDFGQPDVRSFETAAPLPYHSDSSDIVGLYCIRSARSGGASTVVSSAAVHDAVAEQRPDLARLLHEPWATASIVDGGVRWTPICAPNSAGDLFTRYGRMYVENAPDYDATVLPLRPEQIEALDLYDSFLADPSFALDMHFRPGDLQFLNNYRVMHCRAEYVDWPEPERRRELLRVWLVAGAMDVPDVFEDSGFVPRSEALG